MEVIYPIAERCMPRKRRIRKAESREGAYYPAAPWLGSTPHLSGLTQLSTACSVKEEPVVSSPPNGPVALSLKPQQSIQLPRLPYRNVSIDKLGRGKLPSCSKLTEVTDIEISPLVNNTERGSLLFWAPSQKPDCVAHRYNFRTGFPLARKLRQGHRCGLFCFYWIVETFAGMEKLDELPLFFCWHWLFVPRSLCAESWRKDYFSVDVTLRRQSFTCVTTNIDGSS